MVERLKSCMCTQAQLESATFRRWVDRLREEFLLMRKLWEWAFILQALEERGMLQPGRRGLRFAVGQEPLAALFASYGCTIVATDLGSESPESASWTEGASMRPIWTISISPTCVIPPTSASASLFGRWI